MDFWSQFPAKDELLAWYKSNGSNAVFSVNAHLHTPYSFSAFRDIPQALDMGVAEGVKVMGINDFYSTDGYAEWETEAAARGIFPLFNIEYISLNKADQIAGLKVNDPGNPGRTYLSGKGLSFPPKMDEPFASALASVRSESNQHVAGMCSKLNQLLVSLNAGFLLDFDYIRSSMTKGMVRERHLAKALREVVAKQFASGEAQSAFYQKLFGGKPLVSSPDAPAAIENELRNNLLKAGGAAFIPEPTAAFLDSNMVCKMILNQGGIPTYPFLADDSNGNFTPFEGSKEQAAKTLKERNIWSIELITTRNSLKVLEEYVQYFHKEGFVVTLGSEHNTPVMEPIELFARKKTELSPVLKEINYRGACLVAAHQYLNATEGQGYLDQNGKPFLDRHDQLVTLGMALITYLNHTNHA
ncbi:MAG: hypothetical protein M0Q53_00575 [Prolixibacteraceae bacterium]|jgi:hypothetical protein|nr:hypothetical protein [Prolixibacteraceae bacterium]